jgi:hypothetical protein
MEIQCRLAAVNRIESPKGAFPNAQKPSHGNSESLQVTFSPHDTVSRFGSPETNVTGAE